MRLAVCRLSLFVCLTLVGGLFAPFAAAEDSFPPQENPCAEAVTLLHQQNRDLARELRSIHRELAALRHQLEQPGVKEIFSGIGYIFGLCGVAFFFMGRKKAEGGRE